MLRLFSALLGPMFAKEMVETSRRRRYYFNRVFYGAVLLAAMLITWQEYAWHLRTSQRIQDMALMAEVLFQAVVWVQYCAVYLFVPVFVAGVIASEREAGTLELLLTTQLSDRDIVLGKLGSRLAAALLLILSALPILSLVMLFGGVDPAAIVRTQSATLLGMLFTGAHAIYFSSISKGPMSALVRTYWWLAVELLAIPVAIMLAVVAVGGGPGQTSFVFVWAIPVWNPIGPFVAGAVNEVYVEVTRYVGDWYFPASFVIPTAWSGVLIWRAVARLRLPPTLLFRMFGRAPFVRGALAFWSRWKASQVRRRGGRAELVLRTFPVANPLWLRARLARVYDRDGHVNGIQWAGLFVAIGFFLLVAMAEPSALNDDECAIAFLSCTWIGTAALSVIVAASGLVSDRRRGFLDLVLATPLTARETIDGTLLAVWRHVERTYYLAWGLTLLFVLSGASHPFGALMSAVTGTLFGATILFLGVLCSLAARTAPSALVPTFAFPVVMLAVTGLMIGFFEEASGPILWMATLGLLVGSWRWTRARLTPASVGCLFLAVHLALASLATFWTLDFDHEQYPLCMMHAGFLTLVLLEEQLGREFRQLDAWPVAVFLYWGAMGLTIVWSRRFMVRNFDRLAGRTLGRPDEDAAPRPSDSDATAPVLAAPAPELVAATLVDEPARGAPAVD